MTPPARPGRPPWPKSSGKATAAAVPSTVASSAVATAISTELRLLEPGTLQSDLAQDGIPAMVTTGSFCSSDPAPAGLSQVVSIQKSQLAAPPPVVGKPQQRPARTMTINPAALPAGTELSFGNFQLANGAQTSYTLIDTGSYTCTSTAPASPPADGGEIGFSSTSSSANTSLSGGGPS